jgi:hypothetical protein
MQLSAGALVAVLVLAGCVFNRPGDNWLSSNWQSAHVRFVADLNAWVGRAFVHQCVSERACLPEKLPSGLVRYKAVDYRPWLRGCDFWFDVDAVTNVVIAVGYTGGDRQCVNVG